MITTIYNEETISKEINTKWAGKTVHFAKETDSTNEWCKRMSKENAEHGTLAVAEFQSAGKEMCIRDSIRSGSLPKICMETGCSTGSICIREIVFLL